MPVLHALDVLWARYAEGLEPAPVCLSGPYALKSTVRIAPPPSLGLAYSSVVLRGRCFSSGDPVTFRVNDAPGVGALAALVSVEGRVILDLENVGFDLTRPPGRLPASTALSLAGEYDRSRIEACTFRFAASTGLLVSARADAESVTRRASRLMISRSVFEGMEGTGTAVQVLPLAPTMLSVSDCQFGGAYLNAIQFAGSELAIFGCGFASRVVPSKANLEDAADVYLGVQDWDLLPKFLPGLAGANAHLTVTHCRSTSPTFLVGRRVFAAGDSGGAVLTGVLHEPRVDSPEDVAASIRWGADYQPRSLILQGCEFWAPVRLGGNGAPGVVVDLGTRFVFMEAGRDSYVEGVESSVARLPSPLQRYWSLP